MALASMVDVILTVVTRIFAPRWIVLVPSLRLYVKLKRPAAVELPLMVPPALSPKPGGNDPLTSAHVTAPGLFSGVSVYE